MTTDDNTPSDDTIVIRFDDAVTLELDELDVGVADNVLSFEMSGRLKNMSADKLEALTEAELEPVEIHFAPTDT